tara:strand:+ start:4986 stop:5312 length:327 start_codon:yes stop_codon:yes gene_type:complete
MTKHTEHFTQCLRARVGNGKAITVAQLSEATGLTKYLIRNRRLPEDSRMTEKEQARKKQIQIENRMDALKREIECWKARALEAERKCEAWRVETINRAWADHEERKAA